MSDRQLPPESVGFRQSLVDKLWAEECFGYVDQDCFIGTCPVCGAAIGVRFAGYAARATLDCHGGCLEAEIAAVLGLVTT